MICLTSLAFLMAVPRLCVNSVPKQIMVCEIHYSSAVVDLYCGVAAL